MFILGFALGTGIGFIVTAWYIGTGIKKALTDEDKAKKRMYRLGYNIGFHLGHQQGVRDELKSRRSIGLN